MAAILDVSEYFGTTAPDTSTWTEFVVEVVDEVLDDIVLEAEGIRKPNPKLKLKNRRKNKLARVARRRHR